jgi:hypothetical protein
LLEFGLVIVVAVIGVIAVLAIVTNELDGTVVQKKRPPGESRGPEK